MRYFNTNVKIHLECKKLNPTKPTKNKKGK